MMELPNYSSQLMQQLWSLRKEGQFCDCTILVGDSPHRAHKLVLAASSMLFRSLLDGSDTISIDTEMVSSQEFLCLLDMVYTGKLPLGKHNVSRIIAAADSLQMFDVAVGFKNILTCLVNQQPSSQDINKHTAAAAATNLTGVKAGSVTAVCSSPASQEQPSTDRSQDATPLKKEDCRVDGEDAQEQMCRTACEDIPETSEAGGEVTDGSSTLSVKVSDGGESGLAGLLQNLVEVLTRVSSVTELLSQAAQTSLAEEERQVVCRLCEEADSSSSPLEALMSRVKEGRLSQESLLRLLRTIQSDAPSSLPTALHPLLEEMEEELQQDPSTRQSGESEDPSCTADGEKQEAEKDEDRDEDSGAVPDAAAAAATAAAAADSLKPYPCRWCKKTFAYKCRMLTHMKRCPSSKRSEQQCPECPTRVCSQRALRQHQAAAHRGSQRSKKKVACDLCGRTFAHPSGMIYHKRSEHFEEKPFSCEECGAKFAASSSLKNHVRLHTGEKPYRCKHCDMSFAVAAALAYHTKKKHLEGKMYVCQYCKAIFAQSIELTRHVRTHTGDRPYVCRECGKGYNQASRLSVHLQTSHNLSQPHDCQRCCLSFATLEEHRQHIQKVHPKEFHKCASCDKVLTSTALLEKHEATHRSSKPFSCELCNKSYQQLSGLWYHKRTNHPDVFANQSQPLKNLVQCDVCFKFFPTAASLSRHQATEHQGSKAAAVQCPFCPTTLGGDEELQEHLLSVHVELQVQEQLSTSHTLVSAEPADSGGSELVVPVEHHAQQQVLVALAGGGGGGGVGGVLESSAKVMEVNVFGLLNNSVTFICEEKSPESAILTTAGATSTSTSTPET